MLKWIDVMNELNYMNSKLKNGVLWVLNNLGLLSSREREGKSLFLILYGFMVSLNMKVMIVIVKMRFGVS